MLSKKVCKACRNNRCYSEDWRWQQPDDEDWDLGKIFCQYRLDANVAMDQVYVNGGIPNGCYYPLEQAVMGARG